MFYFARIILGLLNSLVDSIKSVHICQGLNKNKEPDCSFPGCWSIGPLRNRQRRHVSSLLGLCRPGQFIGLPLAARPSIGWPAKGNGSDLSSQGYTLNFSPIRTKYRPR
jgi:hypothetical protein